MSILFTFILAGAQCLAHTSYSMKYWFKLNLGLLRRERELVRGAVLVNANIACPNCLMFPWKQSCRHLHLSVPGTQREFKIPFPGLQLVFSCRGRIPAARERTLHQRAGRDISKRLSIHTSKEKGSGPASFFIQYLHSGGRTQRGSFLGLGGKRTNPLHSPGSLIVEFQ